MKYTPRAIPDERTIQIMQGQALNLAVEWADSWEEIDELQSQFFDKLMKPYEPLLRAREEKENLFNVKVRGKEISENSKGDINYEENND